jgi:hypothetical protein
MALVKDMEAAARLLNFANREERYSYGAGSVINNAHAVNDASIHDQSLVLATCNVHDCDVLKAPCEICASNSHQTGYNKLLSMDCWLCPTSGNLDILMY